MGDPVGLGEPAGRRIGRYDVLTDARDDGFVSLAIARVRGVHVGPRLVELAKVERSLSREVEIRSAFLAEARAAARVRSRGFVAPSDTLLYDGDLYVAHELVHGARLSEVIAAIKARGESIPVPIALRIVLDLAVALSELHACEGVAWGRPLVHADVCPDTVMLDFRGVTRVVHSGLSIATRRLGIVEKRNQRLAYKAPVQLRGGPHDAIAIDPSVDVYASAVILWELLAGRCLFDAPTESEVAELAIAGAVPALPAGLGEPAAAIGLVIAQALGPSAVDRTTSAYEWSAKLENAASLAVASEEDVAMFVDRLLGTELERRREQVAALVALHDELAPPSFIAQSVASSHVRNKAPSMAPGPRSPRPGGSQPGLASTPRVPVRGRLASNPGLPDATASPSSPRSPESPRSAPRIQAWQPPRSGFPSRPARRSAREIQSPASDRPAWVGYLVWGLAGGLLALLVAFSPIGTWLLSLGSLDSVPPPAASPVAPSPAQHP